MSTDISSKFIKAFWCYLFLEKGDKNNNKTSYPAVDDTKAALIKLLKAAIIERRTDFFHESVIKPQIVHHTQAHCKHLFGFEKMADIRPAVSLAGRA